MLARFTRPPVGLHLPAHRARRPRRRGLAPHRRRDGARFLSSGAFIAGMLASTAFALYPTVLPAINGTNSLTIDNAAAPRYGLLVGLAWWTVGMILAAVYFVLIYNLFRGKVSLTEEGY